MGQRDSRTRAWRLAAVLAAALISADCSRGYFMSPERAALERAAINRDLKHDWSTLAVAASKRARIGRPDLSGRTVVCSISSFDVQFLSETHAISMSTYACGVAPWRPEQSPAVATPKIKLELLKEGKVWLINAFL